MAEVEVVLDGDAWGHIHADGFDWIGEALTGHRVRPVRASHVEPDEDGWAADMSPVGGPTIHAATRGDALAAEVKYLRGLGPTFQEE